MELLAWRDLNHPVPVHAFAPAATAAPGSGQRPPSAPRPKRPPKEKDPNAAPKVPKCADCGEVRAQGLVQHGMAHHMPQCLCCALLWAYGWAPRDGSRTPRALFPSICSSTQMGHRAGSKDCKMKNMYSQDAYASFADVAEALGM